MARPIYTNTFTISRNPGNGEVILTFGHAYNEVRQLDNNIAENETHREEVISLVTTTHNLIEFRNAIDKIITNN